MPTIKPAGGGTSADALANVKFSVVPAGGAIINMWISGATAADSFGLSIGDRDIIVNGSECNIEIAADVIDVSRDQVVFDEVLLTGGQLYLPVTATAEVQFMMHLRYLG